MLHYFWALILFASCGGADESVPSAGTEPNPAAEVESTVAAPMRPAAREALDALPRTVVATR